MNIICFQGIKTTKNVILKVLKFVFHCLPPFQEKNNWAKLITKKKKKIGWRVLRSSHQGCSVRKGILRNLARVTGKHLCLNLESQETLAKGRRVWLKKNLSRTFLVTFYGVSFWNKQIRSFLPWNLILLWVMLVMKQFSVAHWKQII